MEFKTNSGVWGTMFGVPHVVADNFLKLATGEQLKVLLYCLRCSGRACSDEEISLNTGVPVQNVSDCIMFWQQVNVLAPQSGPHTDAFSQQNSIMGTPPQETSTEQKSRIKPRPKQDLSPSSISERMKNSSDISDLIKIAESALGTLNHTQQNCLIWMFDHLGLKKEVIVTLLFYCVKIEKTNTAYIEKIAADWAEKDINTLSAAEKEVERLSTWNDYTHNIMRIFEMDRRPTQKQEQFIKNWADAEFDIEIIRYAYEKCIENINKLSFDYINKVLCSWKDSGFKTVSDVQTAESQYKKKNAAASGKKTSDIDKYNVVINKF